MSIRLLTFALCIAASTIQAGEVRLRSRCQAGGALVRLADVAEFEDVPDDDRHQLDKLPLFPAPQAGLTRRVTAQDVRETMSLYGLSLPGLRVSGECRVEGQESSGAAEERLFAPATYSVSAGDDETSTQQVTKETLSSHLIAYLQTKERIRTQWKAEIQLTEIQAAAVSEMENPEITGGQAPWTGRQVFNIRDRSVPGAKSTTFKADITRVARAVVSRRQLVAGEIIASDDVDIEEVNPLTLNANSLLTLDDALGKEIKQSIPAGQVVTSSALRRPLVVKRGEMITVYSVAAGIQVKASAKALADAALGDVILLQASETKKQFQGRVTAPQEAMVFVDSPKVAADPAPVLPERVANQRPR